MDTILQVPEEPKKLGLRTLVIWSLLSFGYGLLTAPLIDGTGAAAGYKAGSLTEEVIIALIIGPLAETFIFQFLVFFLVQFFTHIVFKFAKKYFWIIYIIVSTLAFAFSHAYSTRFILVMIPPGVLLSGIFYLRSKANNRPFISVWIIHAIYNCLVFLENHLTEGFNY